jgi:L-alanine-DL-glutamate epimerase-like enolase superfamily enzyme
MKITDVEAVILKQKSTIKMVGDGSQDTVVILLHTDEGITGIGEVDSSPYAVKTVIDMPGSHMACRGLKEIVVGEDAFDIEKIWRKMYTQSLYHGRQSLVIHAMSGIDMAIWDAVGKKLGLPVSKLLGGTFRTKVQAYCSILAPEDKDTLAALMDRHMTKGYQGIKIGWGALGKTFEQDKRIVRDARSLLGDDKYLMIDIGMVWKDVKGAINTTRAFEDYNVYFLEEPFGPENRDAYAALARNTFIHISGGEELSSMREYRDFIDARCVDIIQPDLSRCGGITSARKIADYASMSNVVVIPHAFKTHILMAATLQYIAALPDAWYLEFCEQDTELRQNITATQFKVDKEGFVEIPQKPGLGVELDMDKINYSRIDNK